MSDTENKTQEDTVKEATDTRRCLQTGKAPAGSSSKGFVIPMVLLLAAAIVIISTFYSDEYKKFIALIVSDDENSITEEASNTTDNDMADAPASLSSTETPEQDNSRVSEAPTAPTAVSDDESISNDENGQNIKAADIVPTKKVTSDQANNSAAADSKVKSPDETSASASSRRSPLASYANRQAYEDSRRLEYQRAREQAIERAKAEAKRRDEIISKRRQAYEKEIQGKRQRYEAAMKAEQERRAKIIESQKALYERAEQERKQRELRINEIYKKMTELHKELHQIMRESQPKQMVEHTIPPQ